MPQSDLFDLFKFCPQCGSQPFSRDRPDHFQCPACGFEHFVNPVVAAGALICDADDRVLFVRRANPPEQGKLGLPGGFVDVGETAEEAVRREAREEVNLELTDLHYLVSYPNAYAYKGIPRPVLDLFFWSRAVTLEPLAARDEVEETVFVSAAAVRPEELAFESLRVAVQAFQRQRGQG